MDPLTHLDRVAGRLNRLALQRALYRSIGAGLLAAAVLGPAALWLPSRAFSLLAVSLTVLWIAIAAGSVWALRSHWARQSEAARWVEGRVALDERLLTLVSAPPRAHESPLWPELEADNLNHLPTWGDRKLGIAAVPTNLALLVLGIAAALLALAPGGGDADHPPPPPELLASVAEPPQRSDAVPPPGTTEAEGTLSGEGATPGAGDGSESVASTLAAVQARLGERFARSLVASALGGGTGKDESDQEIATDMRGDLPESDLGESLSQAGGMTPPEGMGHIVQDDADDDGRTVRRFESEGGDGTTAASQGGVREGEAPKEGEGSGAPAPADGKAGERDPDAPVLVSDDATQKVGGSGGSGPGDSPATAALLAPAPLDLTDGRAVARFRLSLGALSDTSGGEGGTLDSDVASSIAPAERGEQEGDRGVRHESVPPEYETVIKRVFERNS